MRPRASAQSGWSGPGEKQFSKMMTGSLRCGLYKFELVPLPLRLFGGWSPICLLSYQYFASCVLSRLAFSLALKTEREAGDNLNPSPLERSALLKIGVLLFVWPGDFSAHFRLPTPEILLLDRKAMSIPSSPPQDVPVRRSSEELTCNSQTPPHGVHRSSFRGLSRGDGVFASPREVVGNIMSSNVGGSPLSRAGYENRRNYVLIFAHLIIPRPGSFNTAITFIQLPPHLGRPLYLICKMILEHTRCSCRTWLSHQKQVIPRH